jgi:hypothetical protein
MIPVKLDLTPAQLRKLQQGGSINVKSSSIGNGSALHLNEANVKKLVRALKAQKGTRITMADDELEGSGLGKKFKKAMKSAKKEVKKAKVGKHVAKSLNKVDKVLEVATPIVSAMAPQLAPAMMAAQEAVESGKKITQSVRNISRDVDVASSKGGLKRIAKQKLNEVMAQNQDVANVINGARDIKRSAQVAHTMVKQGGSIRNVKTYDDQNNFVRPNQSGYNPILPETIPKTKKGGKLSCSCPNCNGKCRSGGSFRAPGGRSGGSFKGGSFK